jgi:hypothetical protein
MKKWGFSPKPDPPLYENSGTEFCFKNRAQYLERWPVSSGDVGCEK